jgi:hypothetical protein
MTCDVKMLPGDAVKIRVLTFKFGFDVNTRILTASPGSILTSQVILIPSYAFHPKTTNR